MIDWTKSMTQTYEYYVVDPNTWKDERPLDFVESATINRDEDVDTLGSATFDVGEELDECYVRAYLVVGQNGTTEKYPLGTHLVQTPATDFDGKRTTISLDAYTPLIELKESPPPIGYSLLKDTPIMETAYMLCREHMRAPVVKANNVTTLYSDFVSNLDDTWITFLSDLVSNAKFRFALDPLGRVLFEPVQDMASLQPVKTFDDGNSSILYPDISNERDLYGIPNVVEVVYSKDSGYLFSRIVNDDPNSPISTVNRGREIVHRDSNPDITGEPTQDYLDQYAEQLLRNLSCMEHTITYKHGFVPEVTVGTCVLLNYEKAGINNVKAKVTSQSIKCETGCPVEETAVYTTKLWR